MLKDSNEYYGNVYNTALKQKCNEVSNLCTNENLLYSHICIRTYIYVVLRTNRIATPAACQLLNALGNYVTTTANSVTNNFFSM